MKKRVDNSEAVRLFASRLKASMDNAGIKAAELAVKTDISKSIISM